MAQHARTYDSDFFKYVFRKNINWKYVIINQRELLHVFPTRPSGQCYI